MAAQDRARVDTSTAAQTPSDPSASLGARLREVEELYRLAPVAVCRVDRNLRYQRANDAYGEIVGYAVEDLVGRTMHEVIHPSAREAAVRIATQVIESGEPAMGEELRRVVPHDPSQERVWLVNVHPVDCEGEVVGAVAFLQNITSVRQAEEAARQRLNELESVYRNAPVGLTFVDRELRYLRVNQVIADANGTDIEGVVGKTYRDLSPENADVAEPFLRGLMDRGESVRNIEVRARPPADPDVEHVYLLSMDPVRGPDGEVIGHTSAVQDVTDLRRAEEAAARRLAELEILYAHTPVGLCYMDADLRIVHLNPLFAQLSPAPLEQQVGASAPDLIPEEIARQLVPQLLYVARTGRPSVDIEVRGLLPGSGSREYTWRAHSHPVRSPEGEVTGVMAVLQDVSALAERQRETAAVRDRLSEAQRVARLGSWEWNILDDEVWWSRELYQIFGEPPSYEPSYQGFFEHVHRADRARVRKQIEDTLSADRPSSLTYRILRPDGTQRVVFTAARLERTADGQAARLLGTCQDVTDSDPRRPHGPRAEDRWP